MSLNALAVAVLLGGWLIAYLIGSIPWAYIIVRHVAHEDISEHGTGNVGAMNVKRTTGSWGWFAVDMVADALKGLVPTLLAKGLLGGFALTWLVLPASAILEEWWRVGGWASILALLPMATVLGSVLGHNYSLWMAIIHRRFARTGKGLATGAGALLAYDWRYFLVVLVVGLVTIAVTRYMMAGQVAAAISLPVAALALGSADWWFALLMGAIVYAAHHKRFVGMLRGQEPRLYTRDRMGPKG